MRFCSKKVRILTKRYCQFTIWKVLRTCGAVAPPAGGTERAEFTTICHAPRGKSLPNQPFARTARLLWNFVPLTILPFLTKVKTGGGYGIRTREGCNTLLAFQAGALDHYANPPYYTKSIKNFVYFTRKLEYQTLIRNSRPRLLFSLSIMRTLQKIYNHLKISLGGLALKSYFVFVN